MLIIWLKDSNRERIISVFQMKELKQNVNQIV